VRQGHPAALAPFLSLLAIGVLAQSQPPASPPRQQAAQAQTPQQQQPRPTFRTGADLVRVDVTVLDRRGAPVPALTAEDFELQEDGQKQPIRAFQFVRSTGQPDDGDEVSLPIRSRSHAAAEAARDDVRVFLIFWDEYHIGQLASATRARGYLTNFVRTAFGPTDLVAFMDPLTPLDSLWFTRDRLELAEHVRRLQGRSGVYIPTRSAVEDAQMQRGDVERLRSEVTLSALKAATAHLGGLRDGRKSVLLISEGLRGLQRDSLNLISDLIRTANDNNTAVYVLDPRGFGPQRFSSLLESVAIDTGGDYFRTNDLEQAMRKVVLHSSAYYLIGYAPTDRSADGKFHKIKVNVKKSGLEVRSRAGYWAPSAVEVERARARAAEAEVPPDVQRAFLELPTTGARRIVDLWTGIGPGANGRTEVRLVWQPRPASATAAAHNKPATVSAVALHGDDKAYEGPVDASGVSFPAPPGPLKLTVTVSNEAGELIDREVRTIDVPDSASPALGISTPSVIRTQGALEFRTLGADPAALPFPGREFVRSDRLLVRFVVYGAAAGDAAVDARIVSQWGKDLAPLPVTRQQAEGARYVIDLPLSPVARGDYLIAITAAAGQERMRVLVPLRVLR
jgi:VWFA-related protein